MLSRQMSDGFNSQERKLDTINNGLCDGFYAQNTNMLNGFSGIQQSLCQGFGGVNTALVQNGYETRSAITDVGYAIKDCCCTTQRSIDSVKYENAQNTSMLNNSINAGVNGIQQAMCLNTRDIIDNQNANFRALHDEIVSNRIEDKNAQIQAQQNEINALRLSASQSAQNDYLINKLRPCPIPAYPTCNPWGCNCNCNTGFGCNC